MLNHITLMGRMTRDPELRYTQSNTAVASFSLAVERDFGSKEEKQTDFIDCVAWRQTGEFISKYFPKGSLIVISGRLQVREYTDKENKKRRAVEVVVENAYFTSSKNSSNGASQTAGSNSVNAPSTGGSYQPNTFTELGDDDGELPF